MHSIQEFGFSKYPEGFSHNPRGHFHAKGRALLANGYSIIPIRRGEKRPAIASWQKSQLGVGDLGRYPDHGVGVLCGQGAHPIVGVDIDISHPVIGPALIAWCLEHLGDSPARVGAAPRILLVYRAAEAGWAKGHSVTFYDPADPFKPSGKKNEQQVEILGNGQQFVAYHEHPDTGREYEWVDLFGGLEFVAASGLPEVTSAQIDALHVEVMRLVRETPGVEVTGSGESPAMRPSASGSEADDLMTLTSRVGTPVDEMRALMAHVENDDANYDMWLKVGMALHHEYGGTEHDAAALQMWRDYGAQSSKDQPDQYGYKWRSFGGSAGSPTTLRWLLKIAHQGKRDAEREAAFGGSAFEAAQTLIAALRSEAKQTVVDTWASRAALLPPDASGLVVNAVVELVDIGRRELNAALRDARRRATRAAHAADGQRRTIIVEPENTMRQAGEVGRLILERLDSTALVTFAGSAARIVEGEQPFATAADSEAPPPPQMLIEEHIRASMRSLVESVAVFARNGERGLVSLQVPEPIVENLLELNPASAPRVCGLLGHPIVTPGGEIIARNGLHAGTGLFVHGLTDEPHRAYSRDEAATALARIAESVLLEFEFATPLDRGVALAGLFTAVQRRVLDSAPGLAIIAPSQASGKTTLARMLHVLVTGRDLSVVNLPIGDDAEIEKRLLALLLRSPEMIVFDNVPDGLTINGGAINAAITSQVMEGRRLGASQIVSAPTNTTIVITGNNLRPGADEVSRLLVTTLAPSAARPETRRFKHPDVVGRARSLRSQVLRDVVGIVAGYIQSGERVALNAGARFGMWDRLVRQPIVWAGGADAEEAFANNAEGAEHTQALRLLIRVLKGRFARNSFGARDVVNLCVDNFGTTIDDFGTDAAHAVRDALEGLKCRDPRSAKSVGWALTANAGRTVVLPDDGAHRIGRRVDRNGTGRFAIEPCGVLRGF